MSPVLLQQIRRLIREVYGSHLDFDDWHVVDDSDLDLDDMSDNDDDVDDLHSSDEDSEESETSSSEG